MRKMKCTVMVAALVCGLSMTAQAQIGTGWTTWSPTYITDLAGTGVINGDTYTITSTSTTTEQRAERRYQDFTFSAQFQGYFKVNSLGGDRICIQQTYRGHDGECWSLIAVKKPGALYEVMTKVEYGSYTIGTQARINAILWASTSKVDNYVNGVKKGSVTGGTGTYDFKLGAYRTASGYGPVTVTWTGLQFWKK